MGAASNGGQHDSLPPDIPEAAKIIESLDYDIDATTLFEKDYSRQTHAARRMHIIHQWVVCGVCGVAKDVARVT